jgi:hypothetical protein
VVLEKQTDRTFRQADGQKRRDYSGAETIGELFDRSSTRVSDRLEPKTKDVDAPAEGGITIEGIELGLTAEQRRYRLR